MDKEAYRIMDKKFINKLEKSVQKRLLLSVAEKSNLEEMRVLWEILQQIQNMITLDNYYNKASGDADEEICVCK